MRTFIFSNPEREILENYLTGRQVDSSEVAKIMRRLEQHTRLFEDVYLYLQIRKTWSTSQTPPRDRHPHDSPRS
jgi:hypothetical protein